MRRKIITALRKKNIFSEIDLHFAGFVSGLAVPSDPDVFLAAALVSRATGEGNICLDLASVAGRVVLEKNGGQAAVVCPPLEAWVGKLSEHGAVGPPGQQRPLILDAKHRLYLYRYWDYEKKLAAAIKARTREDARNLDQEDLKKDLQRLFPVADGAAADVDWQKVAAATAALKTFSVITGGPGTGKSFTIARILALLLARKNQDPARIYLAAPTGKAAARLKESLRAARSQLDCDRRILAVLPDEVYTIHRLLRPVPGSPYFHYNRENPLPADTVIIDEASMVDLALMSKLMQAVLPSARIILTGDKDQLASVEAGAVLGDICDSNSIHGFSVRFAQKLAAVTEEKIECATSQPAQIAGLPDSVVVLQKSYRFDADSGIGALSRAVKRGDRAAVMSLLKSRDEKSIGWHAIQTAETYFAALEQEILQGYRHYLATPDPAAALRRFGRFQILCALKNGPFGVRAANGLAVRVLHRQNLIAPERSGRNPWYRGRPILITRNDYELELFNGDIGLLMPAPGSKSGELYAFFAADAGKIRQFAPHRLPEHETVYAMTVHKSQGSEFEEVLLILPDRDYPVLSRELVYTALTRARQKVSIWAAPSVLGTALDRKIQRASGLREALWEAGPPV